MIIIININIIIIIIISGSVLVSSKTDQGALQQPPGASSGCG